MRGLRSTIARAVAAALLLVALAGNNAAARGPFVEPQLLTPVDPGYPQVFELATPVDPGYPQ